MTAGLAHSGIWSLVGQLTGLGVALVATPFTIRLLGAARYGLWSLLQSAITWIGLADLGMGAGSTRFAGEALAKADAEGEAVSTWTATAISVSATVFVAAVAALFAPEIVAGLLHVHGRLAEPGAAALRLVAGSCVLWAAAANLNTPILIRLRWRTYTAIVSGSSIIQVVTIPVLLALAGGGVVTAALVTLAGTALTAAAVTWVAIRLQPLMRRPRLDRSVARKLMRYGGALTVAGFADIPLTTAERFLLGHYRSTTAVAYYAVASRLALLVAMIPAAVSQPLLPAVVALRGRGDDDGARALYGRALQGSFMLLTPALLMMAFIARPFLALWAGSAYGVHSTVPCFVILAGVWFSSLSWLPLTYLMATDEAGRIARVRLYEIVPYLIAAAVLTSTLGALGAAIVWSARMIVDSLVFFWLGRSRANLPIAPLSARALRSSLLPVSLAVVLAALALVTSSLAERALCAGLLLAVYSLALWYLVLTAREQQGLHALGARINPLPRRGRRSPGPS